MRNENNTWTWGTASRNGSSKKKSETYHVHAHGVLFEKIIPRLPTFFLKNSFSNLHFLDCTQKPRKIILATLYWAQTWQNTKGNVITFLKRVASILHQWTIVNKVDITTGIRVAKPKNGWLPSFLEYWQYSLLLWNISVYSVLAETDIFLWLYKKQN